MGLINLTPHTLNLHSGGYYGSEVLVLQPVGPAPRLVEETAPAGWGRSPLRCKTAYPEGTSDTLRKVLDDGHHQSNT